MQKNYSTKKIDGKIVALQNAANSTGLNIAVFEKLQEDKRRKVKKYFLAIDNASVSPVLNYTELNYFIFGMIQAIKITNQCQMEARYSSKKMKKTMSY